MIRAVTHKLVPQRRVEQSHGPWAADVVAMVGSVVTLRVATTGGTTTVVAVSLLSSGTTGAAVTITGVGRGVSSSSSIIAAGVGAMVVIPAV